MEQLRALAQLRRAADQIVEATQAYDELEGLCCSLSVSTRQIAIMGRTTHTAVWRRQEKRVDRVAAEVAR
jgi:hypothetical protein